MSSVTPTLTQVTCDNCRRIFNRELKRVKESNRNLWKVYCSKKCLKVSRTKSILCFCSRKECNNTFFRIPSELKKVKFCYCSQKCAAVVNNSKITRVCQNIKCRKVFKGNNRKYCSFDCIPRKTSKYSKNYITSELKSFYKNYGRIPVKKEKTHLYKVARIKFGTWNKAIEAAGFQPNPVIFARKHFAKDGHKCDSLAEKIIDDWLSKKKIVHARNYSYPSNDRFTVDFKIGDYWVEFFGLYGENAQYDLLMKRKLKLVKIFPKDVYPDCKFSKKLRFLLH